MTYVMSDIHGESDRFYKMLDLIKFSPADTMYILGDVIDRGIDGVDLLLDIMQRPNMIMLMGNHEDMMLNTLGPNSFPEARALWTQNGGNQTRRELLYHRTSEDRRKILSFCRGLPSIMDIEVNGVGYVLVHGYPSDKYLDQIWGRVEADSNFVGTTVIVGHTPTCYLTGNFREPFSIYHGNGFMDIDCGCGNMSIPFRRLACLRIEDLEEFYV